MSLIGEKEQEHIRQLFQEMQNPVTLVFLTQEMECQFCAETHKLLEEVAALSDKVTLEVYDFQADKEQAAKYGVERIPATAIIGQKDYGVRFYGIPSGYEFRALIEDIMDVSKGATNLGKGTKENLTKLTQPVHFQVFSTPT